MSTETKSYRGHSHKFQGEDGWPTEDASTPCAVCGQTWTEITEVPAATEAKDRDMTASSVENRKSDARFASRARWR